MSAVLPAWLEGIGADIILVAAVIGAVAIIYSKLLCPVVRWARRLESAVDQVPAMREDIAGLAVELAEQRVATRVAWEAALAEFRDENTRQHVDNLAAFSARLDLIEDMITRPTPRTRPGKESAA
jgi:hypothetical protein